jgi:dGTPase
MPENGFYQSFDLATLTPRKRAPGEHRSEFQIDRDRVIHSSAFRRLQSKTQVFLSGEYDFYRTRLTHSIEVAQIGRSICTWLRQMDGSLLADDHQIDPDLVECVCLSHDLGHPPFGHAGERTLHSLMGGRGGFEGNAQTLRLLTRTLFGEGREGMNPTRALLDGVLKYKTLLSEAPDAPNHFVYDDQAAVLEFVNGGSAFPPELTAGEVRNGFRSIECQIMDWADDTAYSVNDLADGIRAKFIRIENLEHWAASKNLAGEEAAHVEFLLKSIRERRVEARLNRMIGECIRAASLREKNGFLSDVTARHRYELVVDPVVRMRTKLNKKIALQLVFLHPALQQLDHKADRILRQLFEALEQRYSVREAHGLHLLPEEVESQIAAAPSGENVMRLVCDYVANMTDSFAFRTYRRLFDADFGSITDLV